MGTDTNDTLGLWLRETYINGSRFGLANPAVDGFFLDDMWLPATNTPPGQAPGPTEETPNGLSACGMTPADVDEMTAAWRRNHIAVQHQIADNGGMYWGGFNETFRRVGSLRTDNTTACSAMLRAACQADSPEQTGPTLHFLEVNVTKRSQGPWQQTAASVLRDLVSFLIMRGPHAWLGVPPLYRYSAHDCCLHSFDSDRLTRRTSSTVHAGYNWEFCGCGGAGGVQQGNPPIKGEMDCGGYPRPESLNVPTPTFSSWP